MIQFTQKAIKAARTGACALLFLGVGAGASLQAEPLKIGYSDWPGWVAWQIGIDKGWFEEEGVEVDFQWYDYEPSMEAYAAGSIDAVNMTNGDALVFGGSGAPSVGIIITDYSNGNDMVVAAPGIDSLEDLKGKKIGLAEGFVIHLLLLKGAELKGIDAAEFEVINTATEETPQMLESGEVDAIGAWQPNSGQALKAVPGSKPVFTSADAPGVIYDLLYVNRESLETRRDDWSKVVSVWYRIVDYIKDEENFDEVLDILSARAGTTPEEYESFFDGTYILPLEEALGVWEKADGLGSVYGSSAEADAFNVAFEVYGEPLDIDSYLDPSLTKEYAASKE